MITKDLVMLATEEPMITFGASAIGGLVLGSLTFLFHRAISRRDSEHDSQSKQVNELLKEFGKLEMKVDAGWRNIDEIKSDVKDLRDKLYQAKK
jgi:hypothetical protein